jgi:SAM-dependent methyltransferase
MKRCLSCASTISVGWTCTRCGYSPALIDGFLSFAPEIAGGDHNPTDFASLVRLEAGNFWFRARNRLITWAIQTYFPNARNALEIGCGTGFVLSGIHQARPHLALSGSEASSIGLAHAQHRVPGAVLFQMDARRIPFTDEFDVIGAFDVLEHIQEDELVLAEMFRAATRGGGIAITVPQHKFLWSNVDATAGHVRRYDARDLLDKVARAGFQVIRKTSFVSLLLPLMVASRLVQRKADGKQAAETELSLNPVLGRGFEKVLDIERALIRHGVSFPAGGSMIILAKKP